MLLVISLLKQETIVNNLLTPMPKINQPRRYRRREDLLKDEKTYEQRLKEAKPIRKEDYNK